MKLIIASGEPLPIASGVSKAFKVHIKEISHNFIVVAKGQP